MRSYLQHGRRHLPTGSDPIPGLASAEYATVAWSGTTAISPGVIGIAAVGWSEFDTTNTGVFGTVAGSGSTPSNTSGDTGLLLMQPGVYFAVGNATWETGTYDRSAWIDVPRGDVLIYQGVFKAIEAFHSDILAGGFQIEHASYQMTSVAAGGTSLLNMKLRNGDTGNRNVTDAIMTCIYWSVANDVTSVF